MSSAELFPLIAKYVVPGFFSMLFRIHGLGARSKKAAAAGMAFYLSISILLPLIFIPILRYDVYKRYAFIAMILANMAVFIISSDGVVKTCFMHFSQANILFWIGTAFSVLRRMLHLSYLFQTLFTLVFCAALYAFALRYWAMPLRFMGKMIHSGWLALLAVPGCTVIVGVVIAVWFGVRENYNGAMMLVVISLLEFAFVMYLKGLYESLCQITRLSRENMRQGLLEAEVASYQEYVNAAKQSRHDLRHHNAVLAEYIKNGEKDRALAYLQTNEEQLANTALEQFSKNSTANAVFRIYSRQAQANDIAFSVNVDLPEALPMAESELSALLSNMLENAVEACRKVEPVRRQIAFSTQSDEDTLRLEMCNSVSGTVAFEGEFPVSTKVGGGIGTRSIAYIVKKQDGMLRFRQEGDLFLTQILLPIPR